MLDGHIFRLTYKPHSVQRLFPVYARPFAEARGMGVFPERAPVRSSL
jgi:hypothetical protein